VASQDGPVRRPAGGGDSRRRPDPPSPRLEIDESAPERSLVALVLALVELLRQLMERQALRRLDHGDLVPEQVERVGATLLALEQRMAELREHFGLTTEDLNLDLGPLGPLLPRDWP
jgi:Gas vesicle protein K